jgi:hypothetical protein
MGAFRESANFGRTAPFPVVNGRFAAKGIFPGDYVLVVQALGGSFEEIAQTGGTIGMPMEFAELPIQVTQNVENISLSTLPAARIRGRVTFEGTEVAKDVLSKIRVTARDPQEQFIASGRVGPDRTFEIAGLSGSRIFRATGLPPGWALQSVTISGQDVTDTPLPMRLGTETAGLEVTFTNQLAELSGTVLTSKGSTATEFVVVLFPEDAAKWGTMSRFVAVAHPDSMGHFAFKNLLPGRYLSIAQEWIEPGQHTDPEFLERVKRSATPLELRGGDKKRLELKLIAQ